MYHPPSPTAKAIAKIPRLKQALYLLKKEAETDPSRQPAIDALENSLRYWQDILAGKSVALNEVKNKTI